jgi:GT2 family glycosyltransferase
VIAVDDGSSNGTKGLVEKQSPHVTVVRHEAPGGYATANSATIQRLCFSASRERVAGRCVVSAPAWDCATSIVPPATDICER